MSGIGRIGRATALAAALAGLPALAAPTAPVAGQIAAMEYRIGPGDELSVLLPTASELNHDGPIGPDGRFTMPYAGALPLAGLTTAEAEAAIAQALRANAIVAEARPSVTIRRYGATVFVGGEVRTPGAVTLAGGMDALQAVIVAGGMLDTARTRRVVVIRRDAEGRPVTTPLDLGRYSHKGGTAGAFALQPRDIVFVPKSSIAEVGAFVEQYINRVVPFSRSLNYNLGNNGTVAAAP
ncbi:MAG: polysaccharide biosynthesis/export family protein [Sphingomonas fennica]